MKTLRSKFNERREVAMSKPASDSHRKKIMVYQEEPSLKDTGIL